MGHRSLLASLPSSAWILATSTAARPGLPERTIRTQGEGEGLGGCCLWTQETADLKSQARHAVFTSFASSHTLQPPRGPGIIAVWSSRWMDGPAGMGRGTRTPDTRPADAVYQYTELAKCLSLNKQSPASALLPLPVWMAWICPGSSTHSASISLLPRE